MVANRVFDEAERALLEFLEEEELRAPEQYFASSADGRDSALSQPPARQFVIDYFQIGAAGRITSPRPERDSLLSLRLEGLLDDQPKREQISLEQRLDATGDLEKKMKALSAGKGRADIQRPGSTKTVQKLDLLERREVVEAEEANLELAEAKEDRPYSSTLLFLSDAGTVEPRGTQPSQEEFGSQANRFRADGHGLRLTVPSGK
ncbi:MAG: hypothetical protein JRG94_16420 [Deltaproteobacteria bacterium]|nr:hypothetical protein [Deltaproteobacteria bacterium]